MFCAISVIVYCFLIKINISSVFLSSCYYQFHFSWESAYLLFSFLVIYGNLKSVVNPSFSKPIIHIFSYHLSFSLLLCTDIAAKKMKSTSRKTKNKGFTKHLFVHPSDKFLPSQSTYFSGTMSYLYTIFLSHLPVSISFFLCAYKLQQL